MNIVNLIQMKMNVLKKWKCAGAVGMLSLFLSSCENADNIQDLEESIESMTGTLEDVNSRLEEEEKQLAEYTEWKKIEEKFQKASRKFEKLEEELTAAKEKTAEASASLKTASLNFYKYRNQYRGMIRRKAKGTLIDLSSIKGPEYKDVRVSRITPLELRVLLPSGPKGIPFKLLPAELKSRFQFSEEEAEAYRQAVVKLRIARAKENKVVDAEKENEQATTEVTETTAAIADKKSQIASLTRRIKAKELEAVRLESLSRQWRVEENNSTRRKSKSSALSRASKASDEANKIRLGISSAKEMIQQLRYEIGQLMKGR